MPLDACSRRELHLPCWGPGLRWVELSARASPEGQQQDGRWRAGAGSALWTGGAGRKEALVSQAGCIPAPCAHLSGQELGCRRSARPAPRKGLRLPRRRPRAPSCREGTGGGATPICSSDPGSVLLTRPGSRIWCPGRSGSRGGFLIHSFWAVSPAGPVPLPASTAIGSCTTLSASCPKPVGRFSTHGLLASGSSQPLQCG